MEEINWFAGVVTPEESNSNTENIFDKKYNLVKAEIKNFDMVSVSTIQRKFEVGYSRGCMIVEKLLKDGFIEKIPDGHGYYVKK